MTHTQPTWYRDSRDAFTLLDPEGEEICAIERAYEQRLSTSGYALEVDDRDKPMVWTIARPGKPMRRLGRPGMSVREAKALALALVTS